MLRLIRRMWMSVHEGLYDAVLLDRSAELSASKHRCWRRRSHFFPALMPKPYSHAFVECGVLKMTLPATHKTLLGFRLAAGTLALMRTTGTCSSLRSGPCHAQSLSLGRSTSTGEGSCELAGTRFFAHNSSLMPPCSNVALTAHTLKAELIITIPLKRDQSLLSCLQTTFFF